MTDDPARTQMLDLIAEEVATSIMNQTRNLLVTAIHLHNGDLEAAKTWLFRWFEIYIETNDEAIRTYIKHSFTKGN